MEKVLLGLMLILAGRMSDALAHHVVAQLEDLVTLSCLDSKYKDIPSDLLDVQWWTGEHLVTRFQFGRVIQGTRFINRTHLSTEGLGKGDFSLSITHTQYSDSGQYRCVLIRKGQKVTLREINLVVAEHVSRVTAVSGSLFHISLPDESAVTVSFQPDVGNLIASVCEIERPLLTCSRTYTHRMLLNSNTLTLTNVTTSDSGAFIIKDKRTSSIRRAVIVHVSDTGTTLTSPLIAAIVAVIVIVYCACACCAYWSRTCRQVCEICDVCCQCLSAFY